MLGLAETRTGWLVGVRSVLVVGGLFADGLQEMDYFGLKEGHGL